MRFPLPSSVPLVACIFPLVLFASPIAMAGGGAATDAYEGIQSRPVDAHALADLYVQENTSDPSQRRVAYRAFDTRSGPPSLGLLHVTLAHVPDAVGFRLDLGVGDMANGYLDNDPAATTHPSASRLFSYAEQAFVTARVPVGRGLSIDVGKIETPVGLEDNESLKNWNYSRSLLYSQAEPTFHSGTRLTLPLSDTVAVSGYWVNGWNANVLAGNGMRAGAGAITWDPSSRVEIVADYMAGLERAPTHLSNPTLALRHIVDGYATYALTERISFATTGDYGRDAALGGVSWWGIGGYVRVQALSWLAGSLRGEHYADPRGFTTGAKQRLAEATFTLEARRTLARVTMIGRIEYRRDRSDARVFETANAPLTRQDTATAAMIVAY